MDNNTTHNTTQYQQFHNTHNVDLEAGGVNGGGGGGCCESKTCHFLSSMTCRIIFYVILAILLCAAKSAMKSEQHKNDIINRIDEISNDVSLSICYFVWFYLFLMI